METKNMLKLHLALLVQQKQITLEQAKAIDNELGNQKIPETIEEIIESLEKTFKRY